MDSGLALDVCLGLGFGLLACFQVCGCVVVTSNGNCVVSLIEGWDQGLGCHRVEVGFRFGVLSSGFYELLANMLL